MKTWTEAKEKLHNYKLYCDDFKFDVFVHHCDGSLMLFTGAILLEEDNWVYIWTEHNGYHHYYCDDLKGYRVYKHTDYQKEVARTLKKREKR